MTERVIPDEGYGLRQVEGTVVVNDSQTRAIAEQTLQEAVQLRVFA